MASSSANLPEQVKRVEQMGPPVRAQAESLLPAQPSGSRPGAFSECPPGSVRPKALETGLAVAPILVWAADQTGTLWMIEGKGAAVAGLPSEAVLGRRIDEVFHDVPEILSQFHRALAGEVASGTAEIDRGFVVDCWAAPLRASDSEIAGVVGVAVDVTARHRAERRLLAEWRRAEGLLRSHEEDRRLIVYEIHDGLVQEATAAQMRLEALLLSGQVPPGPWRQELELVLGLVRNTVSEARQFIMGLRPPVLEERGLVEALREMIAGQPPGGPSVELLVSVQFSRLEPLLETAIYRIVQEALSNVRRHSRSDRAEVRITQLGDHVEVEIRDWGVGFDPASVDKERFGLKGIRQRARSLRGRARIESAPGKGTRVLVSLPLVEASQETSLSNDRSTE
jgi:PAS domain S-box-containing protein